MKSKSTAIKKTIAQILASRWIYYYDGTELNQLADRIGSRAHKGSSTIVILARTCYRVEQTAFPIKSKPELKQVLKSKFGDALFLIGAWQGNTRKVEIVTIKKSHSMTVNDARFLIPEHWLFAKAQKDNSLCKICIEPTAWFSYKRANNVTTRVSGGLLSSSTLAKAALGVSEDVVITEIVQKDYFERLSNTLVTIPWSLWQATYVKNASNQPLSHSIKPVAASLALVSCVYLGISSGYLSLAESLRQQTLDKYGSEITERLDQRMFVQSSIDKIRALSRQPMEQSRLIDTWDIIGFLYLNNVTINEVSSDLKHIEVRGTVESTTDLVGKLTANESVKSVSFIAPVRSSRNGEVFSIDISLKEQARG